MEVLINYDNKEISAWYQFRPSIEEETIQIKAEKVKSKKDKKSKPKKKIGIIPRISIKRAKARAYTELGTTIGAFTGFFRIN